MFGFNVFRIVFVFRFTELIAGETWIAREIGLEYYFGGGLFHSSLEPVWDYWIQFYRVISWRDLDSTGDWTGALFWMGLCYSIFEIGDYLVLESYGAQTVASSTDVLD